MSWIREEKNPPWIHRFCMNVLRTGNIPKHVAFIMDGNRRFAKEKCIEKMEGHSQGFEKLAETLEWCRRLGVKEVTVYAFSIENFKRSKEEVECLMELAEKKFIKLVEERDLLIKHGICVRVLGDLTLLPHSLQTKIAEVVCLTKNHTEATLNVCMPYTSRDEITKAIQEIADGVKQGLILESDVNEELIEKCLLTNKSEDPDLLVRTSGEVRLSDFLLWQSAYSLLSFVKVLWPSYSIWHLYAGILNYQMNYNSLKSAKDEMLNQRKLRNMIIDSQHSAINEINQHSQPGMNNENLQHTVNDGDSDIYVSDLRAARLTRTKNFLDYLENKRLKFFENLCSSKEEQVVAPSPEYEQCSLVV